MKKTLLVTGGSGFIGRNIKEQLSTYYDILAPTHHELDLVSQESIEKYYADHNVDCVINCANIGGSRKHYAVPNVVEQNVKIFYNLTMYGDQEWMIHLGSGAEYDKSQSLHKVNETEIEFGLPKDDYGISKYIISKLAMEERCTILRLFGVFGKYEDYEYKFISNAIVKNLIGLPITINQNVIFDWLYINDLVRSLPYFIEFKQGYKSYNITPTVSTDLITIANIINNLSETPSKIIVKNDGLNNEYTGNNSRFLSKCGDFEFTPIETAISELMDYYKMILPSIDKKSIKRDRYSKRCKTIQTNVGVK